MYNRNETIAAICTAPGEGGVAVIRISGEVAVQVADRVFSKDVTKLQSHTVHYGRASIDHVLLIPMLGGASYTGEETVEIHCHGGSLISKRVLETIFDAGARAALPGEFTFRAFMNGKLDLAQAEAVQEIIAAKSEQAVDVAADQLKGRLSSHIRTFQSQLTEIAAVLEAWVDFPEEGLEFATLDELCDQLESVVSKMRELLGTFHDGRLLKEGIAICLVGAPNVGKSSLMNRLVDAERSIVTHIPGTTRDVVEEAITIGGMHVRLIDTAGIRETTELVEQEGIRRSKEKMEEADLILHVIDGEDNLECDPEKTIKVRNKVDLHGGEGVSAKTGEGIDQLLEKIQERLVGPSDQVMITNLRHKEALDHAIAYCEKTVQGLRDEISPEFLCLDLKEALVSLGRIIGTDITEDVLSAIFSRFCIGK